MAKHNTRHVIGKTYRPLPKHLDLDHHKQNNKKFVRVRIHPKKTIEMTTTVLYLIFIVVCLLILIFFLVVRSKGKTEEEGGGGGTKSGTKTPVDDVVDKMTPKIVRDIANGDYFFLFFFFLVMMILAASGGAISRLHEYFKDQGQKDEFRNAFIGRPKKEKQLLDQIDDTWKKLKDEDKKLLMTELKNKGATKDVLKLYQNIEDMYNHDFHNRRGDLLEAYKRGELSQYGD